MSPCRPRLFVSLILAALGPALTLASQAPAGTAWKLKVAVESAAVRLQPEMDAPIAAMVPRGTLLQSYEGQGAWFKVVATSKDGVSTIGFIATSDVEIIQEKAVAAPDFWPIGEEPYRGLGLAIRLYGGLSILSSADVDASMNGMAALAEETILAKGYSPVTQSVSPFRSAPLLGGDVLFAISPRLSVGAGFSYARADLANSYTFSQVLNFEYSLDNSALFQVYAYRLEAAYTVPLNKTASFIFSAGPAVYQAQFARKMAWVDADSAWSSRQDTRQTILGGHAALALEVNLNNRVGLFVQALGRLARFGALSGTETLAQESHGFSQPPQSYQGDLYFIDDGSFSRTAVRDAPPPGPGSVRKMVVDYSGVSFLVGFRMKF